MQPPSQAQVPANIRSLRGSYACERNVDPRFMPLFEDDYDLIAQGFQQRGSLRRSQEMIRTLVNLRQLQLPKA
ncbi:hypothetical protein C1J03_19025 [Sulfitobacter sp. SK012]|nr:hypothetical protein C1J03_13450 [Sulfitobacter sp. SK012]AXI47912.1 hypothetical protein C1J03_19025 [Sulfitobacter sp. SK012]